jgi:hypothetical protein
MNTARLLETERRLASRFPGVEPRSIDEILNESLRRMEEAGTDPRILDSKAIALACLRLEIASDPAPSR